jgi:glucosamine-6-phosphate deaminase
VGIYSDRQAMGEAAAWYVADRLEQLLSEQDEVRIVVGSAPSQDEFFASLTSDANRLRVDWGRVVVFHMDEYVGLAVDHPQTFRRYQYDHLLAHIEPKAFHAIRGEAPDIEAECQRLSDLLDARPVDLVCLGIGENGHLAFNDPPAAFDERAWVKVVTLDPVCRQQQVNDGCFPTVADVPTQAITLSLRVFQSASALSGVVPAPSKASAVAATVHGPIAESCPATLMRTHPDARLFLDPDSASRLRVAPI